MLSSKGHIQPHHTNLPRRRLQTRSLRKSSSWVSNLDHVTQLRSPQHAPPPPVIDHASTNSAGSTETNPVGDDRGSLPRQKRSLTPITSPLYSVLSVDPLPIKFPLPSSSRHQPENTQSSPQLGFRSAANVLPILIQSPHVPALSGARGHLEPHATNLPRRLCRAQREKKKIRKRCLQEIIPESGVWIAFDLTTDTNNEEADRISWSRAQEEREGRNWMWEDNLGFTSVIHVRLGFGHGECRESAGGRKELELTIRNEEIKAADDVGSSALTDSQLIGAATFVHETHLGRDEKGKLLVVVPSSRAVEGLSIALFALSLPPTPTIRPPPPSRSPSHLSQIRLLPGILELKRSQEIDTSDLTGSAEVCQTRACPNYTPIQLVLWHIHDLMSTDQNDESSGLKQEWRGALSLNGIKRLEKLVASW